jgi:hypothetical protein
LFRCSYFWGIKFISGKFYLNKMSQEVITYPISREVLQTDPIFQGLLERGERVPGDTMGGGPGTTGLIMDPSNVVKTLEEAREKGSLEPLITLVGSFLPGCYAGGNEEFQSAVYAPYVAHIAELREELTSNITFDVQLSQDNN